MMFTVLHSPARPVTAATALLSLMALTACESVFGAGERREGSVSFNVVGAAATAGVNAGVDLLLVAGGGHTLDLQSVDVVVEEATLERVGGEPGDDDDSEADSDSDGPHNARIRVGASTIALPLEGGVITPFSGLLPVGHYDRLELDVAFVRLRGTYDGQPFDVTLPVDAEYELDLVPPLVVEEGGAAPNVTVNVDVRSWLVMNGTVVDPRRLQTDADYRQAFLAQVRASLAAVEDSDRDGDDSDSDSD